MATDKQAFIQQYAPYAQEVEKQYGIPASVTLGQLIQESGWNLSTLAAAANNFFGIKADASWDGAVYTAPTTEYVNGKPVPTVGVFRKYASPEQSFLDRGAFLSGNSRYAGALQETNPYVMVAKIADAGYATDPNYASSVNKIIRDNELYKYDQDPNAANIFKFDPNDVPGSKVADTVIGSVFGDINDKSPQDAYDRYEALNPKANIPTPSWGGFAEGLMKNGAKILIYIVLLVILAIIILSVIPKPTDAVKEVIKGGMQGGE